jgi:hypothetical protein
LRTCSLSLSLSRAATAFPFVDACSWSFASSSGALRVFESAVEETECVRRPDT